MNSVSITGNLGRDVEVRRTGNGTAVCDLSVAVSGREKQGDQWVDVTTWVLVTVWGRRAETCGQYLAKGSKVGVSGRLKLDEWTQDGQKRSRLKVVADEVEFLTPRGNASQGTQERRGGSGGYGQARQGGYGGGGYGGGPGAGDDPIPF